MGIIRSIFSRLTSAGKYILSPRRPFWSRANTIVNEDNSMKIAAFHRGLIYISSQIAKLPWDVKDINNEVVRGPISNLLNLSPNPEMNAFRWRLCMVQNAIIHGNSYAEIERDGVGRPIALWPLETCRMEVKRDTNNGKLWYVYSDPDKGNVYLEPRDVFHLPNFHTKDGIMGQGIVAYGAEVLGIQIAADNMAAGLFHNSGIPSGVLTHPGKLSDEAYKRLKDSWAEQQGGRKTGSTSLLEEGVKYEPTMVDSTALQFLESRQFGVLEIARFLGLPPTKLFDVTAATYSNVEQSNLEVATDTLDTWATNLEMEADVKILNFRYGGRFTDIDLYSIFRGDMKTRSDYFKSMMSVGAMTPNQIRQREGLPGYGPSGDKYFIATNNFTPADRIDEVIDAEIVQKTKPQQTSTTAPKKELTQQEKDLQDAMVRVLLSGK
ncbi:phage portal protein [Candidatus Dojkabacteria bacterium]|uniref:Phage portal protein n=1 Tax=Candidatus Dojkabacteria bacterium TaxID=2099670 RepID=A0A5C7JA51_9BACT|nr:MAG: phage portal protein [Candidatus Dojkabacteria bacterium]